MGIREKMIELLKNNREHYLSTYATEHSKSYEEYTADHLIAHGVTVQEWIPVKKRLPQDDLPFGALCEIVQVLLDDGTVTVGWCNRGLKCWYYMPIQATHFVGHGYDQSPVVAWQPLAQPPKGER